MLAALPLTPASATQIESGGTLYGTEMDCPDAEQIPRIVIYERDNLEGQHVELNNYRQDDFLGLHISSSAPANSDYFPDTANDDIDSFRIFRGIWQIGTDARYRGYCQTLTYGKYSKSDVPNLSGKISSMRPVACSYSGATSIEMKPKQLRTPFNQSTKLTECLDRAKGGNALPAANPSSR